MSRNYTRERTTGKRSDVSGGSQNDRQMPARSLRDVGFWQVFGGFALLNSTTNVVLAVPQALHLTTTKGGSTLTISNTRYTLAIRVP